MGVLENSGLERQNVFSLFEFLEALELGREIEFFLDGNPLFISNYDSGDCHEPTYYIWDCRNNVLLCEGTMEDILNYSFDGRVSLKDNFDAFEFSCIL